MKINCINEYVIIQIPSLKTEEDRKTEGGIILPQVAAEKKRTTIGTVYSSGSESVKEGDRVMFSELGFQGYAIDGIEGEFVVGQAQDIIAIVEE